MENENKDYELRPASETGRFVVHSFKTGKTYYVEPVGDPHTKWGDVDPATKKITGEYGDKNRGSIDENESIITEENGFKNIVILPAGYSPISYIEELESRYIKEDAKNKD